MASKKECVEVHNILPSEPIVYVPADKLICHDLRVKPATYEYGQHRSYVCLAHPWVVVTTKNIEPIGSRKIFTTQPGWLDFKELPPYFWISKFGCEPRLINREEFLAEPNHERYDLDCPCGLGMLVPCESRQDLLRYADVSPLRDVREWAKTVMLVPVCPLEKVGGECVEKYGRLCRDCLPRYC
jgi:hypothetical protein